MSTCALCGRRTGDRPCPALGKGICSTCCGEHRGKVIRCPPTCAYLVAAERSLRERRARELERGWRRFKAVLAERDREDLIPLLDVLKEAIAQGLHQIPDVTDLDVVSALEYCARKVSPIEILEAPPSILGKALEEALMPLVRAGKLDAGFLREGLRALAAFADAFRGDEDEKRFVRALLGTYPPPPRRESAIIRPGGPPGISR